MLIEYGLVKEFCEGVDQIYNDMAAAGLPEPEYSQTEFMLYATLRNRIYSANSSSTSVTLQEPLKKIFKRISEPAERIEQLYEYCKTARSRQEMMDYRKLSDRKYFRENILLPLLILLFHNNSGTR